jgi:hypothetical protein
MKASFLCSLCGQIVPNEHSSRHYKINLMFPDWDVKAECRRPKKLTVTNLNEWDWMMPACQGLTQ